MPEDTYREISFRELVFFVRSYLAIIWQRWWVLLLAGAVFGATMWYVESRKKVRYLAQVAYLVNKSNVSGVSLGGVLGQLGVGGEDIGTNKKLLAISESDIMGYSLLLDSLELDGKKDLLANHLVGIYDLTEEWGDGEVAADRYHVSGSTFEELSRQEQMTLKRLLGKLYGRKDGLVNFQDDRISGLLVISVTSRSAELSLSLVNRIYERVQLAFSQENISDTSAKIKLLQYKMDSLHQALLQKEARLARLRDSGQQMFTESSLLKRFQLEREVNYLSASYLEALRSLESARLSLLTNKPFFQLIDRPFPPLPAIYARPLFMSVIGFLGGSGLAFFLFALTKFYRELIGGNSLNTEGA